MTNGTYKELDPELIRALGSIARDTIREIASPSIVKLSMEQGIPPEQIETLASAMVKIADAIVKQNKMLESLTEAISQLKITVPEGAIKIEVGVPVINVPQIMMPEIRIPPIAFPERKKREITILHDDGTSSTVTER